MRFFHYFFFSMIQIDIVFFILIIFVLIGIYFSWKSVTEIISCRNSGIVNLIWTTNCAWFGLLCGFIGIIILIIYLMKVCFTWAKYLTDLNTIFAIFFVGLGRSLRFVILATILLFISSFCRFLIIKQMKNKN
ncbi:MAG: hypothetical protein PHE88_10100 [Elusimicrobia bacterium]|nr:hypothetical protein [Elusimicrobiota bacterium]